MNDKRAFCSGCDSDYYNGHNKIGVKACWHLESARVVTRFCIDWWTPMDKATNFIEIKTLNCHTESGKMAFLDCIPSHLATDWRELKRERKAKHEAA